MSEISTKRLSIVVVGMLTVTAILTIPGFVSPVPEGAFFLSLYWLAAWLDGFGICVAVYAAGALITLCAGFILRFVEWLSNGRVLTASKNPVGALILVQSPAIGSAIGLAMLVSLEGQLSMPLCGLLLILALMLNECIVVFCASPNWVRLLQRIGLLRSRLQNISDITMTQWGLTEGLYRVQLDDIRKLAGQIKTLQMPVFNLWQLGALLEFNGCTRMWAVIIYPFGEGARIEGCYDVTSVHGKELTLPLKLPPGIDLRDLETSTIAEVNHPKLAIETVTLYPSTVTLFNMASTDWRRLNKTEWALHGAPTPNVREILSQIQDGHGCTRRVGMLEIQLNPQGVYRAVERQPETAAEIAS